MSPPAKEAELDSLGISVAVVIEPQLGLDYEAQLRAARSAERAGFDAFYRSDHYTTSFAVAAPVVTDAWSVLAGVARETERIRLGTLVSPVTWRAASVTAAMAATTNMMSGGRLDLGLGAGWDQEEHVRHGMGFPPLAARLDILDQHVRDIREYLSAMAPMPTPVPTIMIGGRGGKRSRAIAVRGADTYSLMRAGPERARDMNRLLDEECERHGREPRTLRRAVMVGLLIGQDAGQVARRRRALGQLLGMEDGLESWLAERASYWVVGGTEHLRETLVAYADAGCDQVVLELLDGSDLEQVEQAGLALQA